MKRASKQARPGHDAHPGEAPPSPVAVVKAYLDAFERRDFEAARRWLSDGPFAYVGPTRTFDRADAYLADLGRLGLILKRCEWRKLFADGADVCVIFDFHSTLPDLERTRVAEWLTVEAGRITRIEVFLDASPYNRLFDPCGGTGDAAHRGPDGR